MPFKKREDITDKQQELWLHIVGHVAEFGYQPSMTEMAEHFGVTVKAIRDRLVHLENKGYIRFPPKHSDRSIHLKHVSFVPQFRPGQPTPPPPEELPDPNPVAGPIMRTALVIYFQGRQNEPATVKEIADDLDQTKTLVYRVLNHDPDGQFEKLPGPPADRWRLAGEKTRRRQRG